MEGARQKAELTAGANGLDRFLISFVVDRQEQAKSQHIISRFTKLKPACTIEQHSRLTIGRALAKAGILHAV
jgi:hypothetical protein